MKPGDHQKITRKAVELFMAHDQGDFSALLQRYIDDIIDGSKDADTKPLHIRSTNWHFYRANDLLQPIRIKILGLMPLTIYPTSDHILKLRIEQLQKECRKGASDDLFNLAGRILHHTQDMSTPAHVVPVYHGLDVLDFVEDAINVHDSFEDHSETISEQTLVSMDIDATRFNEIVANPCDLFSNYDTAARRTLELLYEDSTSTFSATVNGEENSYPGRCSGSNGHPICTTMPVCTASASTASWANISARRIFMSTATTTTFPPMSTMPSIASRSAKCWKTASARWLKPAR